MQRYGMSVTVGTCNECERMERMRMRIELAVICQDTGRHCHPKNLKRSCAAIRQAKHVAAAVARASPKERFSMLLMFPSCLAVRPTCNEVRPAAGAPPCSDCSDDIAFSASPSVASAVVPLELATAPLAPAPPAAASAATPPLGPAAACDPLLSTSDDAAAPVPAAAAGAALAVAASAAASAACASAGRLLRQEARKPARKEGAREHCNYVVQR